MLDEKEGGFVGLRGGGGGADGVEDEADDGVSEEGDNETDDGIENGVFGVGDFFAIATRSNVA